MNRSKKEIESEIKSLEGKIDKLKSELCETKKNNLNNLFKEYLHTWLYIEGYEASSYLINIDSVEYMYSDNEIGFTGVVIELGTINSANMGLSVKVATDEYGKKYLHHFEDFPYLDDYDDGDTAQCIKDNLDECIKKEYLKNITIKEAHDIIGSHIYWSIYEGSEEGVLEESMNPMKKYANV